MQHHFDIDIANEFGMLEAVLLDNLWYWVQKNKANNKHYYEDRYWTYNSARAFSEMFPYVSSRKIQLALKRLIELEVLQTGNFNQSSYDRTLWYAFTDKGYSIMQKCKMDYTKMLNGLCKNVKPIPDTIQIENTNIKENILKESESNQKQTLIYEEIISYLNEKTNKNFKSNIMKTRALINARLNEGFVKEDFIKVIDNKCNEWLKDKDMNKYLRPETLFSSKFEGYLNENDNFNQRKKIYL